MKVLVLAKDLIFVVITFLHLSDLCYHYTRHILTTYISTKEKKGKLDRIIRRELFLAGPTREIPSRQLALSEAANQSTGFPLSCLLVD